MKTNVSYIKKYIVNKWKSVHDNMLVVFLLENSGFHAQTQFFVKILSFGEKQKKKCVTYGDRWNVVFADVWEEPYDIFNNQWNRWLSFVEDIMNNLIDSEGVNWIGKSEKKKKKKNTKKKCKKMKK